MRDIFFKVGKLLFYVVYKSGTAGAGEGLFLNQLRRFAVCYHISAKRRFNNSEKAKLLNRAYHLSQLCIFKLAGDRRRNNRIDLIVFVAITLFYQVDNAENKGLIGYRSKGALINAGSAGNTLSVVNARAGILVHRNCLYLTGVFAGALVVNYRRIGADLRAGAAFNTF